VTDPIDDGSDEDEAGVAFAVALTLAAVTGWVDAIGFTHLFGVFPANQSGNLVLFGISVGDGRAGEWWRPGLAMLAFVLGVALAHGGGRRLPHRHRRTVLLTAEAVALAVVALLAGNVAHLRHLDGATEVGVLAIAAVAMGVQTVLLGRVAGISVSTTFETGAIVRMSEALAEFPAVRASAAARRTIVVLASVVIAYAGGAAVGTAAAGHWGGALWVPTIVVAGVAAASAVRAARARG
jgi:uncharacterized membrane protein YoaK (UPF0700 family)